VARPETRLKRIIGRVAANWAGFVAVVSFVMSLYTLYFTYLRPFAPHATAAGRVVLLKNPFSSGLKHAALMLDIIFTNRGANRGVVEDVAISLDRGGGSYPLVLRSLAIDRERRLNLAGGWPAPELETFLAFEIGPGESVAKRVLFVPVDATSDLAFEARSYDASLWMWTSRRDDWQRSDSLAFSVDDDDLKSLSSSVIEAGQEGGQFVKLMTRDKPLDDIEGRVRQLQGKLKLSKEAQR
jgi:hypothetical protein